MNTAGKMMREKENSVKSPAISESGFVQLREPSQHTYRCLSSRRNRFGKVIAGTTDGCE